MIRARRGEDAMTKPVVGINCDMKRDDPKRDRLFLCTDYSDAVLQAGGLPILLPFLEEARDLEQALSSCDAVLLTGGDDLDPASYGAARRDETNIAAKRRLKFDLALARAALQRRMPVLGICMGAQLLNVAAGGTLIQHLETSDTHRQNTRAAELVHDVIVSSGSRLAGIVGEGTLGVNSTHHQAIDKVAPGFTAVARDRDGVIEAIEQLDQPLTFAVQWHPERLLAHERHRKLFEALVASSRQP